MKAEVSTARVSGWLQAKYRSNAIDEMNSIKKLILWEYSRETSVYVIFCLLIVAFIFLTPKAWFEKRERLATQTTTPFVQESGNS